MTQASAAERSTARVSPAAASDAMEVTAGRFVGQRVPRREDPRLRHRPRDATSTTSSSPACCTPRSCAATSPGRASRRVDVDAARAAPRCARRAHRRRSQPGPGLVAADDVPGRARPVAVRAGARPRRGRRALRRRPGRARGRREPVRGRGRGRARRGRVRAADPIVDPDGRSRRRTTSCTRSSARTSRCRCRRRPTPSSTRRWPARRTWSASASCSTATPTCRWRRVACWRRTSRRAVSSTSGCRPRTRTRRARCAPGSPVSPSTSSACAAATSAVASA